MIFERGSVESIEGGLIPRQLQGGTFPALFVEGSKGSFDHPDLIY